eukprot:7186439-Prorocentrum_lima.AAC.1
MGDGVPVGGGGGAGILAAGGTVGLGFGCVCVCVCGDHHLEGMRAVLAQGTQRRCEVGDAHGV